MKIECNVALIGVNFQRVSWAVREEFVETVGQ